MHERGTYQSGDGFSALAHRIFFPGCWGIGAEPFYSRGKAVLQDKIAQFFQQSAPKYIFP